MDNDTLAFAAVRYFTRTDDKRRSLIATYYGGRFQYSHGDHTSALATFLQSKELAEELGEKFWAGMSCRGIADVYHNSFNAADELMHAQEEYRYIQESGRQPYINYALFDVAEGKLSKANEIVNLIPHEESLFLTTIRQGILKKQGRIEEALCEMERLERLSNDRFKERINQNLNSTVIGFYDLKEQKRDVELNAARLRMWLVVVIALVVVAVIISITAYILIRQRKEIEDKVLFAEQLQELLAEGTTEQSQSIEIVKSLLASKYKLLEEFCDIVNSCSNSNIVKQKIADSVTTLIESLSVNSDRIVELELEINTLYDHVVTHLKKGFAPAERCRLSTFPLFHLGIIQHGYLVTLESG